MCGFPRLTQRPAAAQSASTSWPAWTSSTGRAAWTRVLQAVNPRFEFTDPPLRHSLPMARGFAATADRPTAVLTGPGVTTGSQPGLIRLPRAMVCQDMVLIRLEHRPLTATAAVVWNGDLPRPLQQVLFDAADGISPSVPAWMGEYEPAVIGR